MKMQQFSTSFFPRDASGMKKTCDKASKGFYFDCFFDFAKKLCDFSCFFRSNFDGHFISFNNCYNVVDGCIISDVSKFWIFLFKEGFFLSTKLFFGIEGMCEVLLLHSTTTPSVIESPNPGTSWTLITNWRKALLPLNGKENNEENSQSKDFITSSLVECLNMSTKTV